MKKISPIFLVVLLSCSEPGEGPSLTAYHASVIQYFTEVGLGFEFGNATQVTRRWENTMKVFVGGSPSPDLLAEMNSIIGEINALSTTGFSIETVADSMQSNYYIFFGSSTAFANMFPGEAAMAATNYGLFYIYWTGMNELYAGHMYVDMERATQAEQFHLLREEFTQSLGLARDSHRYPDSIFQASYSTTTSYAQIDKDLIRLLYHPVMMRGIGKEEVEELLTGILLAEQ